MAIVNSRAAIEPKTGKAAIFVNETIHSLMRKLFSNGEQGFFYDPNDLTTLYQDAEGTVPVTGAGQPVGLIRDKSGRDNHAFQTVSAMRPILQQTPILGNELITNGDFSNGTHGWSSGKGAILSTVNGVLRVTNDPVTPDYGYAWASFPTVVGKKYYVTARRIAGSGNTLSNIHIDTGSVAQQLYTILGNADANKPQLFTATTATTYIGLNAQGNALSGWMEYADISVKEFLGYHTDQNYLAFDGVDDFLQTSNIDFTTTDEVSLFSCSKAKAVPGTDYQTILDFNLSNDGGFQLAVPHANSRAFFGSRGTGLANLWSDTIDWNLGIVLSGRAKISTDMLQLRTNGYMAASAADQGDGTYGNKPLYIGRRAGGDRPFREGIYSLIGIGRLTTDSEAAALEKAIAKKTGVSLNV